MNLENQLDVVETLHIETPKIKNLEGEISTLNSDLEKEYSRIEEVAKESRNTALITGDDNAEKEDIANSVLEKNTQRPLKPNRDWFITL